MHGKPVRCETDFIFAIFKCKIACAKFIPHNGKRGLFIKPARLGNLQTQEVAPDKIKPDQLTINGKLYAAPGSGEASHLFERSEKIKNACGHMPVPFPAWLRIVKKPGHYVTTAHHFKCVSKVTCAVSGRENIWDRRMRGYGVNETV